jgi:hypothetical protein
MSKYTHFTKLKHLIFLNGGSTKVLHLWSMSQNFKGQRLIFTARITKQKLIVSLYQILHARPVQQYLQYKVICGRVRVTCQSIGFNFFTNLHGTHLSIN